MKKKTFINGVLATFVLFAITIAATIGFTDYGAMGVLTVVAFYLFKDKPYSWLLQLISLFLLNVYFFNGMFRILQLKGYHGQKVK
jgi:energy-coupling factor transporter transmembrane protein EcfT